MLEHSQKAAVVELREGEMSGGEVGGDGACRRTTQAVVKDGGSCRRGQWGLT